MTSLIAAELLKLRTTKTFLALFGSALVVVLGLAALIASLVSFDGETEALNGLLVTCAFAPLFALVLGILAVSTEYRHTTVTGTLLAAPRRWQLLVAKAISHLIAGGVLGLAVTFGCVLLGLMIFGMRGVESGANGSDVLRVALGGSLVSALMAVLGVGLGALIKNQAGAIVLALVFLFVVEPALMLIPDTGEDISKRGLSGAMTGLSGVTSLDEGDSVLGQGLAGLLLGGYALTLVALGGAAFVRRDVGD